MPENYYSMFAAPLSNNRDLSVKSLPEKGHSTDRHNPLHQLGMNPKIPPCPQRQKRCCRWEKTAGDVFAKMEKRRA